MVGMLGLGHSKHALLVYCDTSAEYVGLALDKPLEG
jgi:hypothetical protein